MKPILLSAMLILETGIMSASAAAHVPAYPPQEWSLSISIGLSRDIFNQFLNEKPGRDVFIIPEDVLFAVYDDNALHGSSTHPVFIGKLTQRGLGEFGVETLAFIPQADLSSIYSNAFRVLQSFDFSDKVAFTNFNDPGIDMHIDMRINGRSWSVKYEKLQAKDALPENVAALLALLRRNLPPYSDRLFDFMRVEKLSPLSGEIARQYRKCVLHGEWLKVGEARILYGLLMGGEESRKAREIHFPNACTYIGGGCVSTATSPEKDMVLFCESCRKVQKEWIEKNKKQPPKPMAGVHLGTEEIPERK